MSAAPVRRATPRSLLWPYAMQAGMAMRAARSPAHAQRQWHALDTVKPSILVALVSSGGTLMRQPSPWLTEDEVVGEIHRANHLWKGAHLLWGADSPEAQRLRETKNELQLLLVQCSTLPVGIDWERDEGEIPVLALRVELGNGTRLLAAHIPPLPEIAAAIRGGQNNLRPSQDVVAWALGPGA